MALGAAGDLSHIKTKRLITFHDTPKRRLNDARYIFRERRAENGSSREITLKFRHPDRFLAQAREMQARASDAKRNSKRTLRLPSYHCIASRPGRDYYQFGLQVKLRDVSRLFPDLASGWTMRVTPNHCAR